MHAPISNIKALVLSELLVATACTVLLFTGVYGFFYTASQGSISGISGQNQQSAANVLMSKMIEGEIESNQVYRLGTAVSFMIPNGTGVNLYTCGGSTQTLPCNAINTSGEIYFCQDNPCTTGDASARWYYLNSTGTAVMYHYPNEPGNKDITVYTAPTGSTFNLRFSPTYLGSPAVLSSRVVELDVDLFNTLPGFIKNTSMIKSGDVSTYVLLRNHP